MFLQVVRIKNAYVASKSIEVPIYQICIAKKLEEGFESL